MAKDNTIIRTYHDTNNPFAQISRAALQNRDLSWEARGVLGYLLSKPVDWEIHFWDLVNQGPGARDRMRRILNELQTAGHVARQHYNDPVTGKWVWITHVYENPADVDRLQQASSPSTPFPATVKPATVKPSTVNTSIYIEESNTNKEYTNKEQTHHPSRVSTRDGASADNADFDQCWHAYPKRNGKRLEKQRALTAYNRMSQADRAALPAAITNYSASDQIPRDMFRFLARDYWREWLTPATPGTNGRGNTAQPLDPDKYLNGKWAHLFGRVPAEEETA
jgi:hypothetical protein